MRNGNDAAEHARKRKQTAQAAIDTHKRMTAGLHFAVGNTCLGPPLFEHMLEIKHRHEIQEQNKKQKLNQRFFELSQKVQAIRETGKEAGSYNVAELKTVVTWYKRNGDAPLPITRQNLLARYLETCCRGEKDSPYPIRPVDVLLVAGQELSRDEGDIAVVLIGASISCG